MSRKQKLEFLTKEAADLFTPVNSEKLFHKPSLQQWSIAECLHHLIVSNETYFKIFDEVLNGKFKMNFWQKKSPFTKSIASNMLKTLGPDGKQKFKSPKLFLPSSVKRIPKGILNDFLAHQEKLATYISKLEDEKYKELIISSPAAGLITIPLHTALDILLIHEERHLAQAKRLL